MHMGLGLYNKCRMGSAQDTDRARNCRKETNAQCQHTCREYPCLFYKRQAFFPTSKSLHTTYNHGILAIPTVMFSVARLEAQSKPHCISNTQITYDDYKSLGLTLTNGADCLAFCIPAWTNSCSSKLLHN